MIPKATISQAAPHAMQSAPGANKWRLKLAPTGETFKEPLMGWIGTTDTQSQIKLTFDSKEDAIGYAKRNGIEYVVEEPKAKYITAKSYSDNFK